MKTMVLGIMRDLNEEQRLYAAKQKNIIAAADGARLARLGRIAARYELESDEFYTAKQKAEMMLRANPNL